MNTIPHRLRSCRHLRSPIRGVRQLLWVPFLFLSITFAGAQVQTPPSWWTSQGILRDSAAMDYAAANQGQLKNLARAARDEMLEKHLIENGHPIDQMVNLWSSGGAGALDYGAVNLGQLKKVAAPFYDQLIFLGLRPYYPRYPWPDWSSSTNDYAVANLGQLKNMFAFEIPQAALLEYAPGQSARFWRAIFDGFGGGGIVAGDQDFHNPSTNGVNSVVRLEGGTEAIFGEYGLLSGILASNQLLSYGEGETAKAWFKGGTEIHFDYYSGYVSYGTLSGSQPLKYSEEGSAAFKDGSEVIFSDIGYVVQGILSGNQPVKYNANDNATFKDGTEIVFSSVGYAVQQGILSGNQAVKYNANDNAILKDGSEVIFSDIGYVVQGILSGNQAVKYNAFDSAVFMDNTEVEFSEAGFVEQGVLAGNQPLRYRAESSANFQAGTEVTISWGFVSQGILAMDQPIYYSAIQSAVFKAGTQAAFLYGNLSHGHLATAQPLFHSGTQTHVYPSGQVLWFDMPGVPSSLPQALGAEDSDQDGLIDLFEMRVFGSLDESGSSDFNGNGWSNQAEIEFWTAFCGTNRWNLLGDEDLDGLTALEELMMGFNPFDTDTDGDGVNDLDDRMPLDPAVLAVENLVNVSGPPVVQLVTPINAVLVP